MVHIGLGYLSLDRESSTLSGGEAQRTKMVRHLGSALTDVTYVFDEPTIGLHAHDVQQMNSLLQRLRDKGNTVLVVEHDPEVMRSPTTSSTWARVRVRTAARSSSRARTPGSRPRHDHRAAPRGAAGAEDLGARAEGAIPIRNAGLHNLQDVSVDVPPGVLVAVTGVAGSGKSS